MATLWDPIRKIYTKSTPEEMIRQKWIQIMIGSLGYPKGLLSVEKDLKSFASNLKSFDPNRRIDILCCTPHKEDLKPLLLIECKSLESFDARSQILGYNEIVQAPFLCTIQGEKVETFWRENETFRSVFFLPSYSQLKSFLC